MSFNPSQKSPKSTSDHLRLLEAGQIDQLKQNSLVSVGQPDSGFLGPQNLPDYTSPIEHSKSDDKLLGRTYGAETPSDQVSATVITESAVASRLVPRLRMLKLIQARLPHKVRICPGYTVTYWTEVLECGHQQAAYTKESLTAKRRNCQACIEQSKEERTA